ncbi:carbohydrate ABC transporter permease [Microlunatus speluncae]|uniref:carbohydrate ABC transporter permease n=1 Tax=Microlunatus speluncae TaxID=2594267 RepID=UPI0012665696|nr:carbohydrate ABC transporter permease [Microlunatus speluncae]
MTTTLQPTGRSAAAEQPRKIKQKRFSKREKLWAVGISIVLFAIGLAWIYPFIWTLSSSVKNTTEIFGSLNPFNPVLRIGNWSRAWTEANMGQFFFNSVFVTTGSIIISVTVAALMGYALGRYRFVGKKWVIGIFALVIFLPEGYTIIPVYDLIDALGLSGSLWGVTLAEAGGVGVVQVLLFAGYFSQLPKELEEAARVDGAGFLRIFARVYLPLAKPVIATAVILQFMQSWNSFLLPLVLTLTRPELQTLAVGVYALRNDYFADWGVMTAASTIAMLPIIIVFLVLQRFFVESIAGAIKG